jgi:ATP phosphoribosyltransferase
VDEALRLMYSSKSSLIEHQHDKSRSRDPMDEIFKVMQGLAQAAQKQSISVDEARRRCTSKGFVSKQFEDCLRTYEDLGVWQLNASRTTVTFLQ